MFLQDPIHGYIELEGFELDILDTKHFQRLRRVKQLGFTNLVYPSATHTRFEHSIGAKNLAEKFAKYLEVSEQESKELRAASMLHDIGHGPFSHTSEKVFAKKDFSHEDFSVEKIRGETVSDALNKNGISPDKVVSLIRGEGELGQIIAGDIDVDRMDYLMRDAHYSGVAHGVIDAETIMRAAKFKEGKLVFGHKFKQALEGLLTARYLMTPTVYMHEGVIRAEKMMERAIEELISYEELNVRDLSDMDDVDLKARLRSTGSERANYLNSLLDTRDVFKTCYRLDAEEVGREKILEVIDELGEENKVEKELSEALGVSEKKLLVDKPFKPKKKKIGIWLEKKGGLVSLEEESKVCRAINESHWENVALQVYCPRNSSKEFEKPVKNFFENKLGVA